MKPPKPLTTIGRAEIIQLLDYDITVVAKVDSGADLSSIWASHVVESTSGKLSFCLFGPGHPAYTGQAIVVPAGKFSKTRIANSFGHREIRYTMKLRVNIKGRIINGTFTLANRSEKLYPILLGRRLLKGKFVVDVAQGDPLHGQEKARKQKLQLELKNAKIIDAERKT